MSKIGEWVSDHVIFAWRFIKSPIEVGTPFPCSSYAAKEILKFIPEPSDVKRRYVEFGPGTGAFTDYFIRKLGPKDHLDLVEIDKGFCEVLQKKYGNHPQVTIYNLSILDFAPTEKYDYIVTAIPPNSISSPDFLKQIYDCYEKMIVDNGIVSAVEYIGTASMKKAYLHIKSLLSSEQKFSNFEKVLEIKEAFKEKYLIEETEVWQNVLPARVTHFRISKVKTQKQENPL